MPDDSPEITVAGDATIRAALADPRLEFLPGGPARRLLDKLAATTGGYGRRYELVVRIVP